MKKIIILLTVVALYPFCSQAQLNLVFPPGTARGGANMGLANNWEAIGINPANMGWDTTTFSLCFINIGVSAQADQLTYPNLMKVINQNDTNLLKEMVTSHGGLTINTNVIWLAASYKIPTVGTFAISLADRLVANISPSATISTNNDYETAWAALGSTAFTPQQSQKFNSNVNINYADSIQVLNNALNSYNGTSVSGYEYRELNLAWGRYLFKVGGKDTGDFNAFKFYGGLGLKYLMGLANISGQFNNGTISADYAILDPKKATSIFPSNPPGQGYGVDLGTSMVWKNWKFGASVTNIGAINWNGTHATLSDTAIVRKMIENRNDSNNNTLSNYIVTSGEKYKTVLPAQLRLGASYHIIKQIAIATDIIIPLNNAAGNLASPYYSVAGRFYLGKLFTIDAGFATSRDYGVIMPFGFTFGHKVQFYFGTNDIFTWLGKNGNSDLSVAVGLLRINL